MRVEDRIELAKRQLESMIDVNPSVLLLVDRAGTIVRCNRSLVRLMGLVDIRTALGRLMRDVFPCDDAAFFDTLCGKDSGYVVRDAKIRLPDRRVRELRFTTVPSGRSGDLHAVIVHDITDENLCAAETAKSHKQEAVRALAGALMHSLNQPLTVIAVRARLMLMALEKGDVQAQEWRTALTDITDLVMEMSEMLKRAARAQDYVTEPYPGGLTIMDIDKSGG